MSDEIMDVQPDMGAGVEVESHEDANDSMYDDIASRMFDETDNGEPVENDQLVNDRSVVEPTHVEQINAPEHWAKEHKAEFDALTPEAKKMVLERNKFLERMANEKFEKIAAKQKELDAWSALIHRFQSDPEFAQHAFSYDKMRQQAHQPKAPEDPIERIKWEAKQEALKEFSPMLDNMRHEFAVAQYAQDMQRYHAEIQRDPLYAEVQQGIINYISGLPEQVGRDVYSKIDASIADHKAMYDRVRTVIAGRKAAHGATHNAQGNQSIPQPQQRVTRTPVLEDAGAAPVQQASNNEKIKNALFKKIKRGEASSDELGEYFEASGVFDKMFK